MTQPRTSGATRVAPDLLFDDTYAGPRWTYGLLHRPVSTYNLPDGWILWSQRAAAAFPAFGTVDFARELSEAEAQHYSLVRVLACPLCGEPSADGRVHAACADREAGR